MEKIKNLMLVCAFAFTVFLVTVPKPTRASPPVAQHEQDRWVYQIDSALQAEQGLNPMKDTVFTVIHPNSADSAAVVSIVNGVVSVISVYEPTGLLSKFRLLVSGAVTGLILFFWRRRELRKMEKKGFLRSGYK